MNNINNINNANNNFKIQNQFDSNGGLNMN